MRIICLFGQRKDEDVPEFLDGIDEYNDDENPDYLNKVEKDYRNNKNYRNIHRIILNIMNKDFANIFYTVPEIKAAVVVK